MIERGDRGKGLLRENGGEGRDGGGGVEGGEGVSNNNERIVFS